MERLPIPRFDLPRLNLSVSRSEIWHYGRQGLKVVVVSLVIGLALLLPRLFLWIPLFLIGTTMPAGVIGNQFFLPFMNLIATILLAPAIGFLFCRVAPMLWTYDQLFPEDAWRYENLQERYNKLAAETKEAAPPP